MKPETGRGEGGILGICDTCICIALLSALRCGPPCSTSIEASLVNCYEVANGISLSALQLQRTLMSSITIPTCVNRLTHPS